MPSVVVDTDVVSIVFKRHTRARLYRQHLVGRDHFISFMTLAELRLWHRTRHWGTSRRERFGRELGRYHICHSTESMCQRWADVMAQRQAKGRPIEVADAWIAATALDFDIPLVTNNPDDFIAINGLVVLTAENES
jgi:predicted nucleic acid-binding protein